MLLVGARGSLRSVTWKPWGPGWTRRRLADPGRAHSCATILLPLIVFVGLSGCASTLSISRPVRSDIPGPNQPDRNLADTVSPTLDDQNQSAEIGTALNSSSASPGLGVPPSPVLETASITQEDISSPDDFPFNIRLTDSSEPALPSVSEANTISDNPQPSSSIEMNRLSNESLFDMGQSTFAGIPRTADSVFGNASPNLRNRLQGSVGADEEPQFHYPDIHDNPAKRYHELFGTKEEHDPFLFPWIMNLIFEDRWLLAEIDPHQALKNQLQRRLKIDIRDPDPDLANFPNGAYTIPKGRMYIESSPVGFYQASRNGSQPGIYQWEYLVRYGLTDNLEFRVFSNGLSVQEAQGKTPGFVGNQPLAFDFKANFWEENTKYHVPAMGVEIYLQSKVLGSSAFNSGTQPSISLLFDQTLPYDIGLEYNFGYTGVQNSSGQIAYQFSYQWSLQRQVVKDFDVFFHGFYNAAALPRLNQFQSASTAVIPNVTVIGLGGIWTVNNRLALFGSYNVGVTPAAPQTIALLGFALAL